MYIYMYNIHIRKNWTPYDYVYIYMLHVLYVNTSSPPLCCRSDKLQYQTVSVFYGNEDILAKDDGMLHKVIISNVAQFCN